MDIASARSTVGVHGFGSGVGVSVEKSRRCFSHQHQEHPGTPYQRDLRSLCRAARALAWLILVHATSVVQVFRTQSAAVLVFQHHSVWLLIIMFLFMFVADPSLSCGSLR